MQTFTDLVYCPESGILYELGEPLGSLDPSGYLKFQGGGVSYWVHRVIWELHTGARPDTIDHINRRKSDNRWINLRDVSQRENTMNSSLSKNNKSGFNGVYWDKANSKWVANVCVNRRTIYLGSHKLLEDAISARVQANVCYGFHPDHGKIATIN